MKTNLVLMLMLFFSVESYSQTGVQAFTSVDDDITWKELKSENKGSKAKKNKNSGVVTVEVDGSAVDEDYEKLTYVFIAGNIMNCVVEFKEDQTVESLVEKYGNGYIQSYGYEWYLGNVNIIFNTSRPDEVMVLFRIKNNQYLSNRVER
jgi:hypothetical protein